MCLSLDRWGELDEIKKSLEEERRSREEAVRELLDSLEEPVLEPAAPASG